METRKALRHKSFDYNLPGVYYITLLVQIHTKYFGDIHEGKMVLSPLGKIADSIWEEIPHHFENVRLDEYVIMPDHIHGLLVIEEIKNINQSLRNLELVPKILAQYKSTVTREIRKQFGNYEFAWQKSYYDRYLRNSDELKRVREYIKNNPVK